MAFREVSVLEIKEVLRLWLAGREKKVIARLLALDIKTVRRYVEVAEFCGLKRCDGVGSLTEERFSRVITQALRFRPSSSTSLYPFCQPSTKRTLCCAA